MSAPGGLHIINFDLQKKHNRLKPTRDYVPIATPPIDRGFLVVLALEEEASQPEILLTMPARALIFWRN